MNCENNSKENGEQKRSKNYFIAAKKNCVWQKINLVVTSNCISNFELGFELRAKIDRQLEKKFTTKLFRDLKYML